MTIPRDEAIPRLLAMSGSLRGSSNSTAVLQALAHLLEGRVRVEIVLLHEVNQRRWRGCGNQAALRDQAKTGRK